jgi:chorismate mutase
LEKFRKEIDRIDTEVLKLFAKRFEVVVQIWDIKKELSIKPLDENRWQEVLEKVISEWENLGLTREFVVDVWERIHKESLRIEK